MLVLKRSFVLTLLDIFQRLGVYVGGRLSYDDLASEWAATGFRRSDFDTAIDEAIAWGVVALEDGAGGPAVKLLVDRAKAPPAEARTFVDELLQRLAARRMMLARRLRSTAAEVPARHSWLGHDRRRRNWTTLPPTT